MSNKNYENNNRDYDSNAYHNSSNNGFLYVIPIFILCITIFFFYNHFSKIDGETNNVEIANKKENQNNIIQNKKVITKNNLNKVSPQPYKNNEKNNIEIKKNFAKHENNNKKDTSNNNTRFYPNIKTEKIDENNEIKENKKILSFLGKHKKNNINEKQSFDPNTSNLFKYLSKNPIYPLGAKSENELIEVFHKMKEELKKDSFSPNYSFSQGKFNSIKHLLFSTAIRNEYSNFLKELLEDKTFQIEHCKINNLPVVFYLAQKDNSKCLEILIKNGVDLKQELTNYNTYSNTRYINPLKIEEGKTLLHCAAEKGNLSLAKLVLEAGVPVDKLTKEGKTPLFYALKNNQHEVADFLIKNGAKLDNNCISNNNNEIKQISFQNQKNIKDYYSMTEEQLIKEVNDSHKNNYEYYYNKTLYEPYQVKATLTTIAFNKKYTKLLDELLTHDFGKTNQKGNFDILSMVYFAAINDNRECLDILIKHGANLKYVEERNELTLLHVAAKKGNISLAQKVLENGISVNVKSKIQKTPLYYAISNNQVEMVKYLIEQGAEIDDEMKESTNNHQIISLLSKDKQGKSLEEIETDKEWQEAYDYVKNGKLIDLFNLFKQGKDLSKMYYDKEPAPCIALNYKQYEILKFLIHEYDCSKLKDKLNMRNALHYATMNFDLQAMKILLNNGFNPNETDIYGNTALNYAARNKYPVFIETLLDNGADPNISNLKRQNSLFFSIQTDNLVALEILLKHQANIKQQDKDGNTPLLYATKNNLKNCINTLLIWKADINKTNLKKQNVLHLSILNNNYYLFEKFLTNGADINQQDVDGNTPLHYIALFGCDKEILEILYKFKSKLNLNIKNNEGKTPKEVSEFDYFSLLVDNEK